jgi:cysteine desulfurase/selenocysteine lyase
MIDLRADFPIFKNPSTKDVVYCDNAATTQRLGAVLDAMEAYYTRYNANIHRGMYAWSERATAAYESARQSIAAFIHAPSARGVIFTRNATEAINLVSYAWAERTLKSGDEILLTEMEHHSNIVPWARVAKRTGAVVKYAAVTPDGRLDPASFSSQLTTKTKMVGIVHGSNTLGTINPILDLVAEAKRRGALVLVDAAQSIAHLPIDVQKIDCDFLVFSGHKMYGPTGIGVLWGREELLESMEPFLGGGDMIENVTKDRITYQEIPHKFEAGTPAIAEAIGLGAATDYLTRLGWEAVHAHDRALTDAALEQLPTVPGLRIIGPKTAADRLPIFSFTLPQVHSHDIASLLDERKIAIRAGHQCTQPLMKAFGISGTARASFGLSNTPEDLRVLARALQEVRKVFR